MSDFALQRLLTWMSPSFPVGAFAWSAGLETAIAQEAVHDRATTREWIAGNLCHGSMRTDAIVLAHAHKAHDEPDALGELADLCLALIPARERQKETIVTGEAFVSAAKAWPAPVLQHLPSPCPYPIAVGATAAAHGVDAEATLVAFLTAQVQTQISVAVRLVPIGQNDGLTIIAALEPAIAEMATRCAGASLDDIGSIAYGADIAAMHHQNLTTRIFRS